MAWNCFHPHCCTSGEHLQQGYMVLWRQQYRLWRHSSPYFPTYHFHLQDSTKQMAWRKAEQLAGSLESHSLVVSFSFRDSEWHPQGGETTTSDTPWSWKSYLLYRLLKRKKKRQNITSCFVKSSPLISFVFTTCVQKWSVSFWGSEGAFQFKMTFSCFLFHVRNEGGSYFSLIQASKMFPSWQLCWK